MKIKLIEEIKNLRHKISSQKELINYYDQMSHSLGGSDFTTERVDKTRDLRAPFEKWIFKKIDAEDKLKVFEEELSIKLDELSVAIEKIESHNHKMVLISRYLHDLGWKYIPGELGYSSSSVYRLHREGIALLSNLIVNDSK